MIEVSGEDHRPRLVGGPCRERPDQHALLGKVGGPDRRQCVHALHDDLAPADTHDGADLRLRTGPSADPIGLRQGRVWRRGLDELAA